MSVAKDIIAAIKDVEAVKQAEARTTYGRRRQNTPLPAVTLLRIGTARDYGLDNELPSAFFTYEVGMYADNEAQLDRIYEGIRNRFSGLGRETIGATDVLSVQIAGETETDEDPVGGGDETLLVRTIDFRFHVEQPDPTHGS